MQFTACKDLIDMTFKIVQKKTQHFVSIEINF